MCKFAIIKNIKSKLFKIINIMTIVGHTGNLKKLIILLQSGNRFYKSLAIEYARKNINVNCFRLVL